MVLALLQSNSTINTDLSLPLSLITIVNDAVDHSGMNYSIFSLVTALTIKDDTFKHPLTNIENEKKKGTKKKRYAKEIQHSRLDEFKPDGSKISRVDSCMTKAAGCQDSWRALDACVGAACPICQP